MTVTQEVSLTHADAPVILHRHHNEETLFMKLEYVGSCH